MSRKQQQQSLSWKPVIEVLEDRYVMDAWGLALDFGTPTSPVDQLFDQYGTDVFTADKGKGWASANGLQAYDTGVGTDLTRDGVRAKRNTFVMKVPNGTYKVTATLGDGITVSDRISIYVNGTKVVNSFTNTKEQITKISFSAKITKGELRLTFADEGGKNQYFSLADLEVQQVVKPNVKPLVASIEAPSVLDEGTQAVFNAKVTGGKGPYKYSWNFGDGSASSSSASPTHTFKDNGTYKVQLSVKDASGKIVRHTREIVVNNVAPNATIGSSNKDSRDNTFTFNSIVNDPSIIDQQTGFTYRWNFGDGGTSQLANPSHAFSAPGTYTVALVVADKDGGSTTTTTTVQIAGNSTLTASIVPSVANPSEGQPVNFTAQVSGGVAPYTYVWNLNGQEATYSSSYNYTFDDNGSRTISLTVTDKNQVSTTVQLPVNISNVAPTAIFTGTVTGAADRNTSPTGSVVFQNATDISAADRAAGFRYSFDFNNDGIFEVVDSTSATAQVPGSYLLPGNNTVRGRIKDKDNGFTDYNAVLVIPGTGGDTQAPTVNLTTPTSQSTVTGVIQIAALATDNVGVVGVKFLLDNQQIGAEVTSAPFTLSWNSAQVGNGTHTLKAIARDAAGNTTTSAVVQFTVSNVTSGDTTVPTVNLTSPAQGSTVSGTVNITANASDNVGVVGVQFLLDNQPLGAVDTSAPYTFSWNSLQVSNGTHTLSAVARDAAGNLGYATSVVVVVNNANQAPTTMTLSNSTVSATAPAGSTVGFFTNNDPDIGDTFVYTLVSGAGATNNSLFNIQGNALKLNQSLAIGSYSIRVRVTDSANHSLEQVMEISSVQQSGLLISKANLEYVGGFRVPNYYNSVDEFSYGGAALAFNPANNSLFISGHRNALAEIAIPSSIVNSSNLSQLATTTILQPWTNILSRVPNRLQGASDGAPLGGLLVHDGKLIGTQYAYYSGANSQDRSHFVVDSLNLALANVDGLFRVGNMPRNVAGYMTPIPAEWQSILGATHLTGLANVPIVSTSSSGPAVFGFNAGEITENMPAIPYVRYPVNNALGDYVGQANPLQNGNTSVTGVLFVPNSSTVLFFGKTGINYSGYGDAFEYNDPYDGGKGPHSLNGEYASQVWAYNVNDFVRVKNGEMQPWDVKPYNVWNFSVPISFGQQAIGGVTFDPSTNRIYMTSMNADRQAMYSSLPIVQVFQLNLDAVQETPMVGTLAATPSGNIPGAVEIGTPYTLTAGNVYGSSLNTPINTVKFYYDSNLNGTLDTSDQLLGNGNRTPQTNNWTLGISTVNMQGGLNRVFAQAIDINNTTSNVVTAKFTLTTNTESQSFSQQHYEPESVTEKAKSQSKTTEQSQSLFVGRYQFGLSDSPTQKGYEKVTRNSAYRSDVGYGWLTRELWNVQKGKGDSFANQGIGTSDGEFLVDVPNGTYRVTIRLGHPSLPIEKAGVYLQDVLVNTARTTAGQSIPRTYTVKVFDGKLRLHLVDQSSANRSVVIQSLDVVQV